MRALPLSLIAFAFGIVGCASGDDAKPDPPAGGAPDSGVVDARGSDTSPPATACAPGETSTESCGKCGTKKRGCTPAGSWGAFGACENELVAAECALGETRSKACGKCGTRKDTCDERACLWINGTCGGEKDCVAGATEETACASAVERKTRTCGDTCTWGDYSACATKAGWKPLSASALTGRTDAVSIWTGTGMIVFGGADASEKKADGAIYTPATDTWKKIAAPPSTFSKGRTRATAVWTGSAMIVWGGITGDGFYAGDGASYDPATDTWKTIAASPLSPRASMRSVWASSTHQMIVWGGDAGAASAEGAAYDPTTDAWTSLPAAPIAARTMHSMVWTGDVDHGVLVWGGGGASIDGFKDGARYDVSTKAWTKVPDPPAGIDSRYDFGYAFDGTQLLVFGGYGGTDVATLVKATGARVTPSGVWSTLKVPDDVVLAPTARRYSMQAWADAGKLFVWSGVTMSMPTPVAGGAVYDVASDTWTKLDSKDAPSSRKGAQVVWTGSTTRSAIVWGGTDGFTKFYADGATFHP